MVGWFSDGTFVVFLILNIAQIVTILTILIYVVVDVYRRCNSASSSVRSSPVMGSEDDGVAFVGGGGGGLSEETVFKFRSMLEPESVGRLLLLSSARVKSEEEATSSLFTMLKNGHHAGGGDIAMFKKMGRDPLMYMSATTSRFAHEYSPFRAKAFTSAAQLKNKLVCPQVVDSGTAFILPTGHVINKAKKMSDEDLDTWNKPPPPFDDSQVLTRQCTEAPPVHRINVYGFAGSELNKTTLGESAVEMLVCNCDRHVDLLQAPAPETYSSVPNHIQVDVARKRVLLPGPGTEPMQSRQVTAAAHQMLGAGGEHDMSDAPVQVSHDQYATSDPVIFKPVYGSGLVALPVEGAPIRVNCPCTDRPDGIYEVVNRRTKQTPATALLQRNIAAYLNANPVDASKLTVEGGSEEETDFIKSSWLATGKSVTAITCKDETIKNIR